MANAFSYFIGIDVSKDKIDVYSSETKQHFVVGNTAREIRHALFRGFNRDNTLVVIENTGGYERTCIETLSRLGFQIHRANNNSVKHFCKYKKVKAKTDKVDACMLALYGETANADPKETLAIYKPLTESQETLRQLAFFMGNIKRFSAGMKNRHQSPGCEQIKEFCKRIIDFLQDELKDLQKSIETHINSDESIKKKYDLLMEYKGIGKATAMELIAFLPELGTINKNGIASMAGLAPIANDSGQKKGYRTTKGGGRALVKRAMFLAALSAVRFNKTLFEYYTKKTSEGKKKMVAMTACMRKMLIHLNAITKRGYITH